MTEKPPLADNSCHAGKPVVDATGTRITRVDCAGVVALHRQSNDPLLEILEKHNDGSMRFSLLGKLDYFNVRQTAYFEQYDVPANKFDLKGLNDYQVIDTIKKMQPTVSINSTVGRYIPLLDSNIECANSQLIWRRKATGISSHEALQAIGDKMREMANAHPGLAATFTDMNPTVIDDARGKLSFDQLLATPPLPARTCTDGKNIKR